MDKRGCEKMVQWLKAFIAETPVQFPGLTSDG